MIIIIISVVLLLNIKHNCSLLDCPNAYYDYTLEKCRCGKMINPQKDICSQIPDFKDAKKCEDFYVFYMPSCNRADIIVDSQGYIHSCGGFIGYDEECEQKYGNQENCTQICN